MFMVAAGTVSAALALLGPAFGASRSRALWTIGMVWMIVAGGVLTVLVLRAVGRIAGVL